MSSNGAERTVCSQAEQHRRTEDTWGHFSSIFIHLHSGKAELFGGEAGLRGVDYIFEANNSVLVAAAATGLKQSPGQMTSGMTIEASCFRETGQAEQVMDWKELSNDTAALYRNQNFKSFLWKHRMLTGQWEMWIDLVMSCRYRSCLLRTSFASYQLQMLKR